MKKLWLKSKEEDAGARLDRFIAQAGGISRCEARRVLERGGVWVEGKRVKAASRPLKPGQSVLVVLEEAGRRAPDERLPQEALRILFEDDALVAVDKPPFVPAQSTLSSDKGHLPALVSERLGQPIGLVHRLDLETSGVTLFGKTVGATKALSRLFREGTVSKKYLTLVQGRWPPHETVELPLSPDERHPGRYRAVPNGKWAAVTHFDALQTIGSFSLVEARPETGRTHQIRVHLSALGTPILGDPLYGGPREVQSPRGETVPLPRVLLHAEAIRFRHPVTGAELLVRAPIPEDLRAVARQLGFLLPPEPPALDPTSASR